MKKTISIAIIVAGALSASLALYAQNPGGQNPGQNRPRGEGQGQGVCQADRQRFCANIQPGQGRIAQCLNQNKAQLSAPCRQKLEQRMNRMRARAQQVRQSCRADVQQFCAGVSRGQGRVYQCLKQNEAQLSAACKAALQPQPAPAAESTEIPEPVEPTLE
jgi:Cysteine rich repeat